MTSAEIDELFEVKNSLYIGNYQHCINEAQKVKPRDDTARAERDAYLYRALLGQRKYGVVQSQIKSNAVPSLQAIKLLAQFLQDAQQESSIVPELESLVASSSLDPGSVTIAIAAATVYCHLDNYEAALRILNQHDTLECHAEMLQGGDKLQDAYYVYQELIDKNTSTPLLLTGQAACFLGQVCCMAAPQEGGGSGGGEESSGSTSRMSEKDGSEEWTAAVGPGFVQWSSWLQGGDKLQDAYYVYQELIDKNTSTPLLLTGQAACFLGQGKTEEAEAALQEALDKDPNCADALVNLMVLAQHTAKPADVSSRYLAQLRDSHAAHEILRDLRAREDDFDRLVKAYTFVQA
ncbi:coatomer subunit epsilon [Hyalella azteca]|uniref:Coatomer subunit epsilon n=1 Tax=Hyalella azteca TaxID=294128 RepID=A0A8B7NFV3_HYAAZ|nr:coatomer subunit epsilon [Hyalella azteca]